LSGLGAGQGLAAPWGVRLPAWVATDPPRGGCGGSFASPVGTGSPDTDYGRLGPPFFLAALGRGSPPLRPPGGLRAALDRDARLDGRASVCACLASRAVRPCADGCRRPLLSPPKAAQ